MALVVYAVLISGTIREPGATAGVGCSSKNLASSLIFFTTTNFATWALSDLYPHNLSGLVTCYVAALPFYRWMPIGDALWSVSLFSTLIAVGHVQQLVQRYK